MRRVIAVVALVALLVGVSAPAAHAGKSTDIALGLASFAVFNQIVGAIARPHRAEAAYHHRPYREVVYQTVVTQPAVVYAPAPAVYVAPAPPPVQPTVVQYPHGRYELRVNQYQQYVWVWIPAVPPPPPPPPAGIPPVPAPPAP